MTPATVRKLSARAGELAKLPFPIHPHRLRHSAGAAAVPHEAGNVLTWSNVEFDY